MYNHQSHKLPPIFDDYFLANVAVYLLCIFLFLGEGCRHLSSVLLLQLVLSFGIVSLLKPVLKFFLARFPLLLAFLSSFLFLGLSHWRAPLISFYCESRRK